MDTSPAARFFIAGGSTLAVAAGARARVVAQQLLWSPGLLQLENVGVNGRPIPGAIGTVEILVNGSRLHVESFYFLNSNNHYPLPLYRISPVGLLEVFLTNTGVGAATLSATITGRYVPE